MKFFVQLGLAALVLFSLSAAMSVWLYQSTKPTEDTGGEKAAKKKERDPERPDKEPTEAKTPAKTEPPSDRTDSALAALRDREVRLERRAAQMDIILRDLQAQRDAVDALLKQVAIELKAAAARNSELEAKASDLEKQKVDLTAAERKNIERIASMYDSMAPESAAPILRQMADSGRLDTAVKVLSQMKERQAARVLAELGDPALAAQLIDRMRVLKAQNTTATVPAGGPPRPSAPGTGPS
jgi:flagellar motility protein MotE (MotC chaperone)